MGVGLARSARFVPPSEQRILGDFGTAKRVANTRRVSPGAGHGMRTFNLKLPPLVSFENRILLQEWYVVSRPLCDTNRENQEGNI
jgi:hypothetical protein